MNTDSNIQVFVSYILLLTELFDDFNHVKCSLDNSIGLVNNYSINPLALVDFSSVAHAHVAVTNGVDFVNPFFFTQLIEPWKQLLEQRNNFLSVLWQIDHISIKQRDILKFINLPLFVFDDLKDVEGHQFWN